ncbi:MAG: thioredoxin family protein [Armatimonadetes bacterium]|nr:thioredoxin family protein [Armatimonadota bacterium]MDW8029080.1 thioredoxin family protein [Armatimonadota bacterium]
MRAFFVAVSVGLIATSVATQGLWQNALKRAKAEGKYVLAYFFDPECFNCQRYAAQTVDNPQLSRLLSQFVVVKLNSEKERQKLREFLPNQEESIPLPVIVVTDSKGKVADLIVGHLNSDTFAAFLRAFLKGKRTDTIERKLKANPDDLNTIYEAAIWFLERGDGKRGVPLAEKIFRLDPNNRKGFHAPVRLHLGLYFATHRARLAHRAIEEFQQVINLFPNTREAEEAMFYLAVTHLALGQDGEAKKRLNDFLKMSKSANLRQQAQKLLRFLETQPPADLRRGEGN